MRLAFLLLAFAASSVVPHAQAFNATDYGYVADSTLNNIDAIQRTADAALAGRLPGQIARMVYPCGVGGYQGEAKIEADSLMFVGGGGAVVTRDTLADGSFYYPVRAANVVDPSLCVTVLRVLDGAQGRPQPTIRGETVTRFSLRNDVLEPDGSVRRAHWFGIDGMILDGGEAGQLAAIRTQISDGRAEDLYRNAPGHSAVNASINGGADFSSDGPTVYQIGGGRTYTRRGQKVGLLVSVTNSVIRGYAAAGLLGDAESSRWSLSVVRLQDSAYNHIAYNVDGGIADSRFGSLSGWGGWTDVTVAGHSWGFIIVNRGLAVTRLVLEQPTRSPLGRDAGDVINIRGGNVTISGLAQAPSPASWPPLFNNTSYNGEVGTVTASPGIPEWTPTVAGPPRLPPVVEPAPARYRVEARRRCRDLLTGRWAQFVPNCVGLEARQTLP